MASNGHLTDALTPCAWCSLLFQSWLVAHDAPLTAKPIGIPSHGTVELDWPCGCSLLCLSESAGMRRGRRFHWFYVVHEHQHIVFHNEHKLNVRRTITATDTQGT